jgi:epoxyqueuosine reductase
MNPSDLARLIKSHALELGFDLAGIAPANSPPHAEDFDGWVARGFAGGMDYLSRQRARRMDPSSLLPGMRSVLCCAVSYRPTKELWPLVGDHPVSCYTWGRDYHRVLAGKLEALASIMKGIVPGSNTRCFVDSGPVFEKSFAQQAGLGAIGKHTLLLNGQLGSFLFLGEVLTDAELTPDAPFEKDLCKGCRKCMEACPTGALVEERVLDARRCISYRTQREDPLPRDEDALHGMLWGCDLCQKACPYNGKALPGHEETFRPVPDILGLTPDKVMKMDDERLDGLLSGTAMGSAKPGLLKRNALYISDISHRP